MEVLSESCSEPCNSHEAWKIKGSEWEAFPDDLQQTLNKFDVPDAEQGELKSIVNSTRADIVVWSGKDSLSVATG